MKNISKVYGRWLWIIMAVCLPQIADGKVYHVSAGTDGSGNGSEESPFGSLQSAANVAGAGDTVYVAGGTYMVSDLQLRNSGAEGRYLVFMPGPGTGEVVLRHPDTAPGSFTSVLNFSGKSYIWLDGFSFRDFKYSLCAVNLDRATHCVVTNCRFEQLGNADVAPQWNGNAVIWMGNAQVNAVVNNYFADIVGDGIALNSQDCEYNLLANNTFERFSGKKRSWGGEYLHSRCIDVQDMSEGNNVIASNYFTGTRTCIWMDRDGSRNILLRNFAENSGDFIFNESRCAGNIVMENIGANVDGIAFQTAQYEGTGWTFDAQWTNNIAYGCTTGFLIHKSHRDQLRNNIVYECDGYAINFSDSAKASGPHVFLDNIVYSRGNRRPIRQGYSNLSLADFEELLGGEGNLSDSPDFTSLTIGKEDFTLRDNSVAKAHGYGGVDLGAYAVYGPSPAGAEIDEASQCVQAYFDAYMARVRRDGQAEVVIRLTKAWDAPLSFRLTATAGDSREGEDFETGLGEIVFNPGETEKRVPVDFKGMSAYDELVALRLVPQSDAAGALCAFQVFQIGKTADAGPDMEAYVDAASGYGLVTLDATASCDPEEKIVRYVWIEDGDTIAEGQTAEAELSQGSHWVSLVLTDVDGNTYADGLNVTLIARSEVWLEAEEGELGSSWNVLTDSRASGSKYITARSGLNSSNSAPDKTGLAVYTFTVAESGEYSFWIRALCPTPNDDSFWFKMDDGDFSQWNSIPNTSTWQWNKSGQTYQLEAGEHTFTVGYREDGAKLDRMLFTNSNLVPEGTGPETSVKPVFGRLSCDIHLDQSGWLQVVCDDDAYEVAVYSSNGMLMYVGKAGGHSTLDMRNYPDGLYVVKVKGRNGVASEKILK